MMLVLVPPGRGNWKQLRLQVEAVGHLPPPMYFAVGQRIELGGQVFRIARVLP